MMEIHFGKTEINQEYIKKLLIFSPKRSLAFSFPSPIITKRLYTIEKGESGNENIKFVLIFSVRRISLEFKNIFFQLGEN